MNKKLKIAFQSPRWPSENSPNGISKYVSYMKSGLAELGVDTHVFSLTVDAGEYYGTVHKLESQPDLFDRVLWRISKSKYFDRQFVKSFMTIYNSSLGDCDVIEFEESYGFSRLVQNEIKPRVAVRLHGPWFLNGDALGLPHDADFKLRVAKEGAAIGMADIVSSPSKSVLNDVRRYYQIDLPEAVVINNPAPWVDDNLTWNYDSCDRNSLLFVGRFDKHKGADVLLQAFALLLQKFPELRLVFVGPDQGLVESSGKTVFINEYLDRLGISESVDYLGQLPQSQIPDLRRRSFVTIVSSNYENFGNTVLEALAFGSPLVTSLTGGLAEISEDGVNSLGFMPGDSSDLRNKVETLLLNHDLARDIASGAIRDAREKYSIKEICRQTFELFGMG